MRRRGRNIDGASFRRLVVVLVAALATRVRADASTIERAESERPSARGDALGRDALERGGARAQFPSTFTFGVGTSAWQIEGAGGKRPRSTWDAFAEARLGERGSVEAKRGIEFYERYEDDAKMMGEAGVRHFKMSLSWPRLMRSDGTTREDGFKFYERVFAALRSRGVEPHVALFHWDTPIWLCANATSLGEGVCEGAWAHESVVDEFAKYADAVFARLGDGVKYWTTISEPKTVCELGYGAGMHAPGKRGVQEQLTVGHNMLKAHARAVAIYRKKYSHLGGKISINLNSAWAEPASTSSEDVLAAKNAMDEELGWFADPISKATTPAACERDLGTFCPSLPNKSGLN